MTLKDLKPKDIFSKSIKFGRRTYFFDVRETQEGDYYLTIAESKKVVSPDDKVKYIKHKIYLYKESFEDFKNVLDEVADYIYTEKGKEVISRKNEDYQNRKKEYESSLNKNDESSNSFEEIKFEDI